MPELNRTSKNGSLIAPAPSISIFSQMRQGAEKYGVIPIGLALWNAQDVYKTLKKVKNANDRIGFLDHYEGREIVLLAGTDRRGLRQRHRREIEALDEFIDRCYFKVASCGLRVLQLSTILISHPSVRKGVNGVCDMGAHTLLLTREVTTQTTEQLLTPAAATWKDEAHRWFKTTLSVVGIASGVFGALCSLGYVAEEDVSYQVVMQTSMAMTATSVAYAFLQSCNIFAKRD